MLICANGMRLASGPNRMFSGVTSTAGGYRSEQIKGSLFNRYQAFDPKTGTPNGARHPVAFVPAQKAGGLASRSEGNFAFTMGSLNLAAGVNIDGATSFAFTVDDAQLNLVVSASGDATVTFSTTSLLAGALQAEGTTSVTFTVPTVTLGAVISATATAGVTFSAAATSFGLGFMEGSTVTTGDILTAGQVADEVWSRLIESGLTAEDALKLIAAATAGEVSGGGTTTVTIRNAVADTKNRITATVDAEGNRTAIAYDLDV